MVLDVINSSVLKIIEPYRKWIIENPQLLCEIENMVHCLPYFTAGLFWFLRDKDISLVFVV